MSFAEFFKDNWIIFTILIIVIIAILIYEIKNSGKSGTNISNIQASALINEGAILIDTRPYPDYKKGHIANAINVPKEKFADFIKKQQSKKDKTYLLYCQTGLSTRTLAQQLNQDGFEHVYTLKGGLDNWLQDNLPIV